ncbi:glycosyltransferase family 2 protein [Pontibacter anaerobius]|uniref:Glycosyltransferase n=1 Tax=Pontibacter anaerobius TaxID=2993940 RepID=A0ABT3RDT3_9BACT|nr:glycosyltransferase [Pontibacter anaerobius]MCX2740009.1 glycosyltransferase [Pontibacter anaerobius]
MSKVTVLMPVYNAEKYIAEAIESILCQSLSDFEFLIVDDGSTDKSAEIIHSYTDSRIRFVQNQQNMGIAATLNKGIYLASASYIARMDADDISYPNRLLRQYTYLQQYPDCSLVGARTATISEAGRFLWKDDLPGECTYYNLTFFCSIYHPTVMFRKETVMEAGMYILPYAEDYELWCRLSRKNKLHVLPEVLLDYRLSSKSTSNQVKKEEYNQTELTQILNNLRYFAGDDYTLPDSYLECFRFNYAPLLAEQNVRSIADCMAKLQLLTNHIIAKENVNRDRSAIIHAAKLKWKKTLSYFLKKLPLHKAIFLLIYVTAGRLVYTLKIRN